MKSRGFKESECYAMHSTIQSHLVNESRDFTIQILFSGQVIMYCIFIFFNM